MTDADVAASYFLLGQTAADTSAGGSYRSSCKADRKTEKGPSLSNTLCIATGRQRGGTRTAGGGANTGQVLARHVCCWADAADSPRPSLTGSVRFGSFGALVFDVSFASGGLGGCHCFRATPPPPE